MTPETEARALVDVQDSEGLRLMAYMDCCGQARQMCRCPTPGHLTIGFGQNLDSNAITPRAARVMLEDAWREKVALCRRRLKWFDAQPEARQAGLVECAYNGALFASPKAIVLMDQGRWAEAEAELLDGPWIKQVGERRARRVARMIGSGQWPA